MGRWAVRAARGHRGAGPRSLSNILCFRFGRDPAPQVAVRERLVAQGRFQLSSTEVHGWRWLRMTVMEPATDERTVEALLDAIESAAAGLVGAERLGGDPSGEHE